MKDIRQFDAQSGGNTPAIAISAMGYIVAD
jgi:hypothetical protein